MVNALHEGTRQSPDVQQRGPPIAQNSEIFAKFLQRFRTAHTLGNPGAMNKRIAVTLLVVICLADAVLLATNAIRPTVGAVIFGASLLILGGLSGGFRNAPMP
jgi:hypothetical protein